MPAPVGVRFTNEARDLLLRGALNLSEEQTYNLSITPQRDNEETVRLKVVLKLRETPLVDVADHQVRYGGSLTITNLRNVFSIVATSPEIGYVSASDEARALQARVQFLEQALVFAASWLESGRPAGGLANQMRQAAARG